jgi:hypothetical protein
MLSHALISELQEIFRQEYGQELTESEATSVGESMLKVFESLASIHTSINQNSNEPKTLPKR